jgi:hypothetical protein
MYTLESKIKILKPNLYHHGFKLKAGLNQDHHQTVYNKDTVPTGLHYTDIQNIECFLHLGSYIADVVIPDDAQVAAYASGRSWKADQIILENIRPIAEHPLWSDQKIGAYLFQRNPTAAIFQYIKDPPLEMCLQAVQGYGCLLQYIPASKQTPEICEAAIHNIWWAFRYVHHQTDDLKKLVLSKSS